MGVFAVNIRVCKPARKPKWVAFKEDMVDSGSEVTWLPEAELESAGIEVFKKDQVFLMANGQPVTRDVGIAVIQCGEFKTVDEVVFAKRGDLRLLGARTLEGFNAVVNPREKRLIAAGPLPAAQNR